MGSLRLHRHCLKEEEKILTSGEILRKELGELWAQIPFSKILVQIFI
jgi:hypothetical protein